MADLDEGVVSSNSGPVAEATPPSTPADEAPASDVNWSDFAADMDSGDSGDGDSSAAVEGAEEVPAPESQEPPPADSPAVPPQAPAPTPTPTPSQEAVPTPPQTPSSAAPEPQVKYEDWRKEQVEKLAGVYKLSDEMASQLLTEPEVVLPQVLAGLHMSVLETVMNSVTKVIPSMVKEVGVVESREGEARNLFFSANADLKDAKFEPAIMEFGQMYRKVNPNASPEEAAKVIGNMVRTAYGMTSPAQAPATTPPAAPAPAPFVPARGGGSGATPPAATNIFTQLAEEFTDD